MSEKEESEGDREREKVKGQRLCVFERERDFYEDKCV